MTYIEPLRGLDTGFLYLESPTAPLHVGMVVVLAPAANDQRPAVDRLRTLLAERLPRMPLLRQRLRYPLGGLLPPVWVDDPGFDLADHIVVAPRLADLTSSSLAALAADVLRHQLPRDRPLWELYVAEAAGDPRVAVIAKVHHALLDGVAGLELFAELVDLTPDPPPAPVGDDEAPVTVNAPAVTSLTALLRSQARVLDRVTTELSNVLRRGDDQVPPVAGPLRSYIAAAPTTSMTRAVTARRSVAMASLDMDDLTMVRKGLGGTLNDVVLAVCAGGLRRYLGETGLPNEPLVAAVPVSLRGGDDEGGRGNRVSVMLVPLATDVEDPRARLEAISASSQQAKLDHARLPAASFVSDVLGSIVPSLGTRAGAVLGRSLHRGWPSLPCNLIVSNVPGPPFRTFMAGMEVASIHPLGPILDGVPLNITVLSHHDRLEVGITACPTAVPACERLPGLLGAALDELVDAAAP